MTTPDKQIQIPAVQIELQDGERYSGVVLDAEGRVQHHLVLMAPRPDASLNWSDAVAWAISVGGNLPTRQEAALLYANCKPHLLPHCHWTCEEGCSSGAWDYYFKDGGQGFTHQSFVGSAVAVRRIKVAV